MIVKAVSHSSKNRQETERAAHYLNGLFCQAVDADADTLPLERVPEGLEICFFTGGTGVGNVLNDRKLEAELIALVVRRAGLGKRAKGKMNWNLRGEIVLSPSKNTTVSASPVSGSSSARRGEWPMLNLR